MNRKLARKVAKTHGVSVKEVRAGIKEAIDYAYQKPNFYAGQIYSVGATPTADEFIAHVVREAKAKI